MLRSCRMALFTSVLVVIASALVLGTIPAREVSAAAPRQSPEQCAWVNRAAARPKVALVGEEITTTVSVSAVCPESAVPLNIVLVLDGSGSMAGEPNREMKKAARNLIQRLNMKDNPATQVGVVMYNGEATILCELTNGSGVVNGCVGRVGATGGSRLRAGIDEGLRVLSRGREDAADASAVHEVIVVMSNDVDDCEAAIEAARRAREQGVRLAAVHVCVGSLCDEVCLRRIPDGPDLFFLARDSTVLSLALAEQRAKPPLGWPLTTMISATVPSAFALVADSPVPDTATIGPGGRGLSWRIDRVPADGITVTWRLRALAPGLYRIGPLAASAGTLTGTQSLTIGIQSPQVLVVAPRELATATPAAPPGPTPTPTQARPTGVRLYLPAAMRMAPLR